MEKLRHVVSVPRIYRYLTARQRCLPDFIIAGAAKAGTTSLWWYLIEHPHVERPITKEVRFFDVNFPRGLNWYRMHFPLCGAPRAPHVTGDRVLTGESTPYYMFHPLVPERIAAIPVGYADGYPQALSNRADVLVRGKRCPIRGRVTMNEILIDVTRVPDAVPGDKVTLIGAEAGETITVEELAAKSELVPHRILAGIGPRVARDYIP